MVHSAFTGDDARADEAALRVAGFGVLDLDDVGAPVGQHRPGRRYERPRGEFDHADTTEDVGHEFLRYSGQRIADDLGLQVLFETFDAVLPADAAHLVAAERRVGAVKHAAVHHHRPG